MAIEYVLLGLLRREPRHGYQLAQDFAAGTTLGEVLRLEPSMLYAYLKKLESAGFVEPTIEPHGGRPPRRVYALTPSGDAELDRWLSEPVTRTRDARLEFLLKLYVAHVEQLGDSSRLIGQQQRIVESFIESLSEQIDEERDDFRRRVLQLRLAQNEALLGWLADTRRSVAP